MKTKNIILGLFISLLVFAYGCVQMRDYTGIREGAFGLDVNKGFDQGVDKKDYYLINEDVALIVGDSKDEVIFKIGLPDSIKMELDGHESWIYKERKIDLFFSDGRLRSWSCSRYEDAKTDEAK